MILNNSLLRSIVFSVIGLMVLLLLQGCAMGGGTIGTGLSYGSSKVRSDNLLRFSLQGIVVDSKGKPIPNAKIILRSSEAEEHATSDSNGRFVLPVVMQSGRALRFTVATSLGTTSCTRYISPAGEDSVSVRFILDKYGQVVCTDL